MQDTNRTSLHSFPSLVLPPPSRPSLLMSLSVSLFVPLTDLTDSHEKWLSLRLGAILLQQQQFAQSTSALNARVPAHKSDKCVCCCWFFFLFPSSAHFFYLILTRSEMAHVESNRKTNKKTSQSRHQNRQLETCTHSHRCRAPTIFLRQLRSFWLCHSEWREERHGGPLQTNWLPSHCTNLMTSSLCTTCQRGTRARNNSHHGCRSWFLIRIIVFN